MAKLISYLWPVMIVAHPMRIAGIHHCGQAARQPLSIYPPGVDKPGNLTNTR
jgi:hypothetical protein